MDQATRVVEDLEPALLPTHAPTMGNLAKLNYSHADMIDFIIANPGCTQNHLAARYGYSVGWVSNVMASDAWQSAMAARRAELVDPVLTASVEERFRGLTVLSIQRLTEKLEKPNVSDNVVLKAVELGAKGLGAGAYKPPAPAAGDQLERIAHRLIDLQSRVRDGTLQQGVIDGEAKLVEEA